jgi:ribosome-associated toxin RatA of RatAB toxin-antitoxin module
MRHAAGSESTMTVKTVDRSLLLAYTPAQMFALVNDVPRYPEFLPWCAAARIVQQDATQVLAAIDVRKGPLHLSFTTRNDLDPDRSIRMELVDGPFRALRGSWSFDDIGGRGARVTLRLEYDFAMRATRLMLEPVFDAVCHSIVSAFARRAREIHGRGDQARC